MIFEAEILGSNYFPYSSIFLCYVVWLSVLNYAPCQYILAWWIRMLVRCGSYTTFVTSVKRKNYKYRSTLKPSIQNCISKVLMLKITWLLPYSQPQDVEFHVCYDRMAMAVAFSTIALPFLKKMTTSIYIFQFPSFQKCMYDNSSPTLPQHMHKQRGIMSRSRKKIDFTIHVLLSWRDGETQLHYDLHAYGRVAPCVTGAVFDCGIMIHRIVLLAVIGQQALLVTSQPHCSRIGARSLLQTAVTQPLSEFPLRSWLSINLVSPSWWL